MLVCAEMEIEAVQQLCFFMCAQKEIEALLQLCLLMCAQKEMEALQQLCLRAGVKQADISAACGGKSK